MKTKNLIDAKIWKGNDFLKLKNLLSDLTNSLYVKDVKAENIIILSLFNEDKDNFYFDLLKPFRLRLTNDEVKKKVLSDLSMIFDKKNLMAIEKSIKFDYSLTRRFALKKSDLYSKGITDELFDEIRKTGMLFLYEKTIYFVSDSFVQTILLKTGISGSFFSKASTQRNECIAKALEEFNMFKIVYKKSEDGIKKIFSFSSVKYSIIKQDLVYKLLNNIEKYSNIRYNVSNGLTEVWIDIKSYEFSTKTGKIKFYSGLKILTSDSDASSFTVNNTLRVKEKEITLNSISKKHIGEFNFDEFVNDVLNNIKSLDDKILNYLKEEKDLVDISDKNVKNIITDKNIISSIGAKRKKELFEYFNDTNSYGLFAIKLVTLPNLFDLGVIQLNSLSKACGTIFNNCIFI